MWVITIKEELHSGIYTKKYRVGYWIEMNGLMQFEIFEIFEDKNEAIRCCNILNGGNL